MMKIALVIAGGAIGTLARYGLTEFAQRFSSGPLPLGTLAVNLAGSLAIGALWGLWEANAIPQGMRVFIFAGLLGGFTTFSAYTLETMNLFRDGQARMALLNMLTQNILGMAMVLAGFAAVKGLLQWLK